MTLLRKIFVLPLKIFVLLCVLLFVLYHLLLIDIPDIRLLQTYNPSHSSYMNTDTRWFSFARPTVKEFIPYDKVPKTVVRAILVAEDDTFFGHEGFNWDAIEKSLKLNFKKKKILRGGSTITQQLARNLFLSRDKTIFRKLREAILTYKLEHTLSKERIFELYVNYAEFGPGIYGLAAASEYHFKTSPTKLSGSQAALLAAVLPNPKFYAHKPYPRITLWRQNMILNRMARYDPLAFSSGKEQNNVKKNTKEKTVPNTPVVSQKNNTDDVLTQTPITVPTEETAETQETTEFLDE